MINLFAINFRLDLIPVYHYGRRQIDPQYQDQHHRIHQLTLDQLLYGRPVVVVLLVVEDLVEVDLDPEVKVRILLFCLLLTPLLLLLFLIVFV